MYYMYRSLIPGTFLLLETFPPLASTPFAVVFSVLSAVDGSTQGHRRRCWAPAGAGAVGVHDRQQTKQALFFYRSRVASRRISSAERRNSMIVLANHKHLGLNDTVTSVVGAIYPRMAFDWLIFASRYYDPIPYKISLRKF